MKTAFAENGIYDEKATSRRVQGVGKILEVWQGWAMAIQDSKATFVGEYASGDTAIIEVVWKGTHTGPLQTATGAIPPSNKRIELSACQVIKVEGGKVRELHALLRHGDPADTDRRGQGLVASRPGGEP